MINIQAFAAFPAEAGFMLLAHGQGIALVSLHTWAVHGRNEAGHGTKFRFLPAYTLDTNGHAKSQLGEGFTT